jgi:hypothetical protein
MTTPVDVAGLRRLLAPNATGSARERGAIALRRMPDVLTALEEARRDLARAYDEGWSDGIASQAAAVPTGDPALDALRVKTAYDLLTPTQLRRLDEMIIGHSRRKAAAL